MSALGWVMPDPSKSRPCHPEPRRPHPRIPISRSGSSFPDTPAIPDHTSAPRRSGPYIPAPRSPAPISGRPSSPLPRHSARRVPTGQAGGGVDPLEQLPGAQLAAGVGVRGLDGLAHVHLARRRPLHGCAERDKPLSHARLVRAGAESRSLPASPARPVNWEVRSRCWEFRPGNIARRAKVNSLLRPEKPNLGRPRLATLGTIRVSHPKREDSSTCLRGLRRELSEIMYETQHVPG